MATYAHLPIYVGLSLEPLDDARWRVLLGGLDVGTIRRHATRAKQWRWETRTPKGLDRTTMSGVRTGIDQILRAIANRP